MSILIRDYVTRADAFLSADRTWTDLYSANKLAIRSGQIIGTGVSAATAYFYGEVFTSHQHANAEFYGLSASPYDLGLVLRGNLPVNTPSYYVARVKSAAQVDILKCVGGSFTLLGSATGLSLPEGVNLLFVANFATLSVYQGNTLLVTVNDGSIGYGSVGAYALSNAAGVGIDKWEGGNTSSRTL